MIPCTDINSLCEVNSHYFFGSSGVCNSTSEICECPLGFEGRDDVINFNSCHISSSFKESCHLATIILSSLACFVSICGLFKLWLMWGVLFWQNDSPENGSVIHNRLNLEKSEFQTKDESVLGVSAAIKRNNNNSKYNGRPQSKGPPISPTAAAATLVVGAATHLSLSTSASHQSSNNNNGSFALRNNNNNDNNNEGNIPPLEQLPNETLVDRQSTNEVVVSASDSPIFESSNRKSRKSRAPRLSIKPMTNPKTNARTASFFQDIAEVKRRRNICLLMTSFVSLSICTLITEILFQKYSIQDKNFAVQWFFGSSFSFLQSSLWILALTFCGSLPSMKTYGIMFPSFGNHPLIRFPRLSWIIVSSCISASLVVSIVFFLVLPLIYDPYQVYSWVIPVGLTIFSLFSLAFLVFQSVVFHLILKMFKNFTEDSHRAGTGRAGSFTQSDAHAKAFAKAKRTVLVLFYFGLLIVPLVIVVLLTAAWTQEGRKHMYFFISIVFCIGNLLVIGCTFVFVYRISAGNARKKEDALMKMKTENTISKKRYSDMSNTADGKKIPKSPKITLQTKESEETMQLG